MPLFLHTNQLIGWCTHWRTINCGSSVPHCPFAPKTADRVTRPVSILIFFPTCVLLQLFMWLLCWITRVVRNVCMIFFFFVVAIKCQNQYQPTEWLLRRYFLIFNSYGVTSFDDCYCANIAVSDIAPSLNYSARLILSFPGDINYVVLFCRYSHILRVRKAHIVRCIH